METEANYPEIIRQLMHISQFIAVLIFGRTSQVIRTFIIDFQKLLVRSLKKRALMEAN